MKASGIENCDHPQAVAKWNIDAGFRFVIGEIHADAMTFIQAYLDEAVELM